MKQFRGYTRDNTAICSWGEISGTAARYERFIIEVRRYDPEHEISLQQMRYLHAVVFPAFADWIGCSEFMAELILKRKCGKQWMVKIIDDVEVIASKTSLSVKQTMTWIENIMDFADGLPGLAVPPPDPEWRTRASKK